MKHYLVIFLSLALFASTTVTAHDAADEMTIAAQVWLDSLDADQQKFAIYKLTDGERENWHFIPKPFEGKGMRGGITLKAMRPDQRHLAYALLSSGLSHRGYLTATQIMSLEQVLWELSNHAPKRDTMMYYMSIFGKPGSDNWGWRFEGHHLSLNFTIAGGKLVSGTPNFFASNPGVVLEGPRKGLQVLASEENQARELVQSLSKKQRKVAVIKDKAPRDILTSAEPTVKHLGDAGIAFGDLNKEQQAKLFELIDVYVHRLRGDFATEELEVIKAAGHDKIVFAWAGGVEKNEGHYYRIQGPTFLLEYANTQNGANHVHAVWRDFDGDFGRDLLKEHYQSAHKSEGDWVDLFDGKTLTNWTNPYDYGEAKVVDGEIRLVADKKFFLCSEKIYSDFIFEAEVKLPEGKSNSGFMFRCHVKPNKAWGYQAEVDDSERAWSGGLYDEGRRGWLHPKKPNDSPSGDAFREKTRESFKRYDWNKYRIHAEGTRLRIWVNGVLCTDYTDDMDAEGFIGLQHHGEDGQVYCFRNIRIKEL